MHFFKPLIVISILILFLSPRYGNTASVADDPLPAWMLKAISGASVSPESHLAGVPPLQPAAEFTAPFAAQVIERGTALEVTWVASNIPEGYAGEIVLNRMGSTNLEGSNGKINDNRIPISNGPGRFVWNGKTIGCVQIQPPATCDDIEPGLYQLTLNIYNDQVSIATSQSSNRNPEVSSKSGIFRVNGAPNLVKMNARLDAVVLEYLATTFELFNGPKTEINPRYFSRSGTIFLAEENKYCQQYVFKSPFSGSYKVCEIDYAEKTKEGTASYMSSVLPYTEALKIALKEAVAPYASKARPSLGTKIEGSVANWIYRVNLSQDQSFWLILIVVAETGGTDPIPNRFLTKVAVKIFNSRTFDTMEVANIAN